MSKFSFNRDEDQVLVDEIAKFRAIYDPKSKHYRNLDMKDSIWMKISERVGRSLNDCKKRWRYIRGTYYKHQRSGKSRRKPPQWVLYPHLSFLGTIERKRLTFPSVFTPKEESENDSIEITETIVVPEEDSVIHQDTLVMVQQDTAVTVQKDTPVTVQKDTPIHKETVNDNPYFSPHNKLISVDTLAEVLDVRSRENIELLREFRSRKVLEEDDVDTFFRSIALTVKKFPPRLQTEAKLQTLTLIADIEKRSFNNETETRNNTFPF